MPISLHVRVKWRISLHIIIKWRNRYLRLKRRTTDVALPCMFFAWFFLYHCCQKKKKHALYSVESKPKLNPNPDHALYPVTQAAWNNFASLFLQYVLVFGKKQYFGCSFVHVSLMPWRQFWNGRSERHCRLRKKCPVFARQRSRRVLLGLFPQPGKCCRSRIILP